MQVFVWNGQDVCRWLLLRLHDVELTSQRDWGLLGPFHKCNWSDFGRVRDAQGRSNFFGLEVTHKSLVTNLAALAIAVYIAYWIVPRSPAALIFAFVAVDSFVPWSLIAVCGLSRLRPAVMFLIRTVRA